MFQCLFSFSLMAVNKLRFLRSSVFAICRRNSSTKSTGSWSLSVQQFAMTSLRPEHMSLISACRSRRCWTWDAPNAQSWKFLKWKGTSPDMIHFPKVDPPSFAMPSPGQSRCDGACEWHSRVCTAFRRLLLQPESFQRAKATDQTQLPASH